MNEIVVIGLARSGTSVVSAFLSEVYGYKLISEPHALWRSGTYLHMHDDARNPDWSVRHIRSVIRKYSYGFGGFVEKSPINVFKPEDVSRVFPSATVIFVIRERDSWENSINRKNKSSSSHGAISVWLRKYLWDPIFNKSGRSLSVHVDASGDIPINSQLALRDIPLFFVFAIRMLWLKKKGLLPFGNRLNGFSSMVKNEGLLSYYRVVYEKSFRMRDMYRQLYGKKFIELKYEDFVAEPGNILKLLGEEKIKNESEINKMIEDIRGYSGEA